MVKRTGVVWAMLLVRDVLAVNLQHPGAALGKTGPVVLEVKFESMFAGSQRLLPFPPSFLDREEIIGEDRLALEQIEPVTAETATVGDDHPFPTTGRNLDIRRDRVGLGEDVRRVAIGRAGQFARIGELGSPSDVARLGGENAREVAIVQGEDLVFRRFHDEEFLHLPQLVGHRGCEIVGLRVVVGDVIEFPFVAVDHVGHLGPARNHGG